MYWIFPIAGKGERVKSLGSFKPFIKIKNKNLLEHFLNSIESKIKTKDRLYFVSTSQHEAKYNVSKNIKKILKKLNIKNKFFIKLLKATPNGPGLSVLSIIDHLKINKPCLIINPDQIIDFYLPKIINKNKIYIPVHFNNHGNSSYVQLRKNGEIFRISEKKLISNYASSGVYIFGSLKILKKCYKLFNSKIKKKEVNMSDIINNYLKIKNTNAQSLLTYMKYDLGNSKNIKYFVHLIERNY